MKYFPLVLLSILSTVSFASVITQDVNFSSKLGHGSKLEAYRVPGMPLVPVKNVKFVLPFGEDFDSLDAVPGKLGIVSFRPERTPIPRPLCDGKSVSYEAPDYAYPFPAKFTGKPFTISKHGYKILYVPVFEYRLRGDGTAEKVENVHLTIHTQKTHGSEIYRGLESDRRELPMDLENPDALTTYPLRSTAPKVNYLAIAPQSFIDDKDLNSLTALLQDKNSRGLTTEMLATETIDKQYQGRDAQEKIRNAVIDYYKNKGLEFLLLVGNGYSSTPARILNVHLDEGNLPSDFYYACLDGDYDGNHNDIFGEPDDGANGGDVDLSCEVAVGRAPVSSADDMHHFVAKTLKMNRETALEPRIWNELNFGEKLDDSTLGSGLIEHVLTGGKVGELATKGFPTRVKATKLYETFSQEFSSSDVIQAINTNDIYTLDHIGHANEDYCMRMASSDIASLTNPMPFFGITQGCHPGNLNGPNWASKMVTSEYAAAGMVANSNYGYYNGNGSDDGPSNHYNLMFWDAVFSDGQRYLGKAHYRAKEKLIAEIKSDPFIRWVAYETNLLADPELYLAFPK